MLASRGLVLDLENRAAATRLLLSETNDRSLWYNFCEGRLVQQGANDRIRNVNRTEIKRRRLKGGILSVPVSIAVPSN